MAAKSSKGKRSTHRKLTAILCADVVGYSRLMGDDEEATLHTLTAYRKVFTSKIKKHRGRVVDAKGDALLAEFERASDAVSATLAFQADQAYYLSRLKDDLKPSIRVGLAMGEVVMGDSTVTGAGVVLAQRIEQLAEPGSLCITAALHEALPNRMPFDLENIGEQTLKGFDDPVRGLARTSAGVTFDDRGERSLKGVAEPQRLFAVRGGGE